MRIDEVFCINNNFNTSQSASPTEKFQFFELKGNDCKNSFPTYFSAPKYLGLKNLVMKYDLSNISLQNSSKLNFADDCRKSFVKDFGIIKSSSMQQLVLDENSPFFDSALGDNINKMSKECRQEGNYAKSLRKRMQERKIDNCTDIACVTADEINKKQSAYKADLLYASILNGDMISNHVAVLIQDKIGSNDKLNADSVVLDNWLGGVFKYKDWVKIIKNLYNSNSVSTHVTDAK